LINRQFAALQGLAILLVVVTHSIGMGLDTGRLGYPPPSQGWLYSILLILKQLGIFAVPTFLFISGCFFSYSARGVNPKLSWKVVWAGLKHLLWPYLFWSIAFYIWIHFRWHEVYTPLGHLKNLAVGYPYNFIPLIAFYYVLSPILVRLARRFGFVLVVVIGLYQLILLNMVYPGTLGFTFPVWMGFLAPPVIRSTLALWAIYFPLGLVYSANARALLPQLQRFRWAILATAIAFFMISLLDLFSIWRFPLASFICPPLLLFFSLTLQRDSIPMARELEKIGRKAYGLYLTHLLVLDLVLFVVHLLLPWLFNSQALLQPILLTLALVGPLLLMNGGMRLPSRPVYRYVFG
jgi:peptidoglycan/LPS O-acetylase OafA/YrhL